MNYEEVVACDILEKKYNLYSMKRSLQKQAQYMNPSIFSAK